MKTLLLSLAFISSLASAAQFDTNRSYEGRSSGLFKKSCTLEFEKNTSTNGYGQETIAYIIKIKSGSKEFQFSTDSKSIENATSETGISAITGSDFFVLRPTKFQLELDQDLNPTHLLIDKEGKGKILECKDFN